MEFGASVGEQEMGGVWAKENHAARSEVTHIDAGRFTWPWKGKFCFRFPARWILVHGWACEVVIYPCITKGKILPLDCCHRAIRGAAPTPAGAPVVESGDPDSCHLPLPLSFRGSPRAFWTLGSFSLKWRRGTCPRAHMSEMLGLSVLVREHVVQSVLAGGQRRSGGCTQGSQREEHSRSQEVWKGFVHFKVNISHHQQKQEQPSKWFLRENFCTELVSCYKLYPFSLLTLLYLLVQNHYYQLPPPQLLWL